MASGVKTRIKLPATAALGDVITVKTLVTHQMQNGHMRNQQGEVIPRNIIYRFTCTFEGETVIDMDVGPSIANNPFFEFEVRVTRSGTFDFTWYDDDGSIYRDTKAIEVA